MNEKLIYTHLDSDIHSFRWLDVSPKTVDVYMSLLLEIRDGAPSNSRLLILHDYRGTGTPAFNTLADAMKKILPRHDLTVRIAHLYSEMVYPITIKSASLVTGVNVNRKFFREQEEQKAIEWLLDDDTGEKSE